MKIIVPSLVVANIAAFLWAQIGMALRLPFHKFAWWGIPVWIAAFTVCVAIGRRERASERKKGG